MLKQANKAKESAITFEETSNSANLQKAPLVSPENDLDKYFQKEVKVPKKQVSIYLDEDVIQALNKWSKPYGKGAKSDLVNNFLKKQFNIRQGD